MGILLWSDGEGRGLSKATEAFSSSQRDVFVVNLMYVSTFSSLHAPVSEFACPTQHARVDGQYILSSSICCTLCFHNQELEVTNDWDGAGYLGLQHSPPLLGIVLYMVRVSVATYVILTKHLYGSISFEVMLPSACSFIVDGSLSYV
jgi:hypothetical protein